MERVAAPPPSSQGQLCPPVAGCRVLDMDRLLASRWAQLGWFLLFGLLTRAAVFGDLSYFNDEMFYFVAGQRMHDGLIPYVDVWDRKGPGLFLTYYLIAGISRNVLAYQLAAWLSAALTAQLTCMIAEKLTGRIGAVMGGTLYLAMLPMFGGAGGQSPVFYTLYVALAAWLVVRSWPDLRRGKAGWPIFAAMASAGFALTFKQTVICEAAFLGGFVLWQLLRSGMAPLRLTAAALGMALAGMLPFLIFSAGFAMIGHFAEFWHAMITSNLKKSYNPAGDHWQRIGVLCMVSAPALIAAITGAWMKRQPSDNTAGLPDSIARPFLIGWLLAALIGVAMVPNFYEHYMLPLVLPISVAAARAMDRKPLGTAFGAFTLFFFLANSPALHFAKRELAREAMTSLARDIRARDPHPRLLIYEGPQYLYAMLDSYPPSPLLDSFHLYFPPEDNVSHLDTAREMQRDLDWQPSVVLTYHDWPTWEESQRTAPLVHAYTRNCRLWFTRKYYEIYHEQAVDVYGDCKPPSSASRSSGPVATGRKL